ncbi:MAG: hypothetical protein ACLQJ0_14275, partial [Steroidobacteraceae bacterium]
ASCVWPICPATPRPACCNAVRRGLTAETVIGALEDAEDYKAFEAAICCARLARSCSRSMFWIVANHKNEGGVSTLAIAKGCSKCRILKNQLLRPCNRCTPLVCAI